MPGPLPKTERNQEIYKEIQEKGTSFETLASRFNVTKQRISQIYYKLSGELRGHVLNVRREERREARRIARKEIKFRCAACGKPVSHNAAGKLVKYCRTCNRKSQSERRDMNITLNCQQCKKKFHPYRSKRTSRRFCSRECYFIKMTKDPSKLQKRYAQKMANKRKG